MQRDRGLIPLSHQHHNGLALCVLTRRALAADSSPKNRARLARRIADRYELELVNHFQLEEQVLFPEVEARLGAQPAIAVLVSEHRTMATMVADLQKEPTPDGLESFCALLSAHIRREENEFFPMVQESLPRDVLDHIGGILDARATRICL